MKLRPPSFLMLGMLRLGASSGYAVKKATDVSTRFFWPTSLAQVYPELARLERAGLVTRRDDPRGARARSAYQITESGQQALVSWLNTERLAPTQFRDEGILRLFFADALPGQDRLTLVRRLRERAQTGAAQMQSEIVPVADALRESGTHFPAVVAHLGFDTYTYVAQWLARLEEQLRAEQATD
jgi:DNA-binding PadR family transcriptional regulator